MACGFTSGTIIGTLFGALLIGLINNGLILAGLESSQQQVVRGAIIILAVALARKAPISSDNFLKYVDSGFYNNTIFHRVIPGFMVQGGGFTSQMVQKQTRDPIRNEASNGLHNVRGTLSMARTSNPNSATSQFFINVADNAFLDPGRDAGYAVFAKVVNGMDVVDQIVNSQTTTKQGMQNVPIDPVLIKSAKRLN